MEENIQNTRKIIYGAVVMFLLAVLLLVFFVIKPQIRKVYESRDRLEEEKLRFELMKVHASESRQYNELTQGFDSDRELFEKAVISKDSIVGYIQEIENISASTGNQITIKNQVAVQKKKRTTSETEEDSEEKKQQKEEEDRTVRLELQLEGNYKQFLQFLFRLQNMTKVFNIESLEIKAPNKMGSFNRNKEEELPPDYTIGKILVSFVASDK